MQNGLFLVWDWLYYILGLHFLLLNSRKLVCSPVRIGNCCQMIREVRPQELCSTSLQVRKVGFYLRKHVCSQSYGICLHDPQIRVYIPACILTRTHS
jgi:hypothetical protein